MGNLSDPNDPFYKSQPGWQWDPGFGAWINVGGAGAADTEAAARADAQKREAAAAARNQAAQQQYGTSDANREVVNTYRSYDGRSEFSARGDGSAPKPRYQIDPNSATQIDTQWRDQLKNFFGQLGEQKPPTIDQTQSNEMRGVQTDLIKRLQDQAAGVGPSLAQAQLQKASDQNLANTLSAIQATRGMGATAAGASAAGAGAAAGQQLAQDSAIVRLQEQMQAQGLLSNLASGTRGQDIGIAAQNAQMELQQQDSINQLRTKLIGDGLSFPEADRRARMQVLGMNQQGSMFSDQLYQQDRQFNRQQGQKETMAFLDFFKGLLQMGANAAAGGLGAGGITG